MSTVGETAALVTADYEVALNGLKLGGSSNVAYNLDSVDIKMPTIKSGDNARAFRYGLDRGTDILGGRSVLLSGVAFAGPSGDLNTVIGDLRRACVPGGYDEVPFAFRLPGFADGKRAFMQVRVRDLKIRTDVMYSYGYVPFSIRLDATSPYLLSTAEVSSSIVPSAAATEPGRTFNKTYSYQYGVSTPATITQVTNEGSASADYVISVSGVCENPVITNLTTGEQIGAVITLGADDTLTFDSLHRTVVLNDSVSRYANFRDDPDNAWWQIAPGTVALSLSTDSGSPDVTVSFRNHYL